MDNQLLTIILKIKSATMGLALSLLAATAGIIGYALYMLKDYRLKIPIAASECIYLLLSLSLLYAVFGLITIYAALPQYTDEKLNRSLKKLNISYIIISTLSVYAAVTMWLNLVRSVVYDNRINEYIDYFTGNDPLLFLFVLLLIVLLITIVGGAVFVLIVILAANFIINIGLFLVAASDFKTSSLISKTMKKSDYFLLISIVRILITVIITPLFIITFRFGYSALPLIICEVFIIGFMFYNIFALRLLRQLKKYMYLKNPPKLYPKPDTSQNINKTKESSIDVTDFFDYNNSYDSH